MIKQGGCLDLVNRANLLLTDFLCPHAPRRNERREKHQILMVLVIAYSSFYAHIHLAGLPDMTINAHVISGLDSGAVPDGSTISSHFSPRIREGFSLGPK